MAGMIQRCLVSSVEHLSGTNKQGRAYDFLMLRYVRLDALSPSVTPDGNSRGIKFQEISLDSKLYSSIPEAPAIYDVEIDFVQVRGEDKILPVSFNYVNSFFDYFSVKKDKA